MTSEWDTKEVISLSKTVRKYGMKLTQIWHPTSGVFWRLTLPDGKTRDSESVSEIITFINQEKDTP